MIRTTQMILVLLSALVSRDMTLAFAPTTNVANSKPSLTSLQATKNDSIVNTMATSILAASVFFLAAPPDDALALQPPPLDSTSQVMAARSGGRMGGRSYSGSRAAPTRSYSSPSRSATTTTYSRTTVVRPAAPAVIVAPTYSPFGFNPFFPSPFGFGLGIGDSIRDYRQDDEIARDRRELEQQRLKNMELEQRLAQLERGQAVPQQQQPAAALPPQLQQATADPELEAQRLKNVELEQKVAQLEKAQQAVQPAK